MSDSWQKFSSLWDDIRQEDEFFVRKPLLAHYTSIAGIEKILMSNELWFSNPLYMNDHEEVGFGVDQGSRVVRQSTEIRSACGSSARYELFQKAFEECYWSFAGNHAFDTYVFCLSEHKKDDHDGVLSMWRGYGGGGNGAALVIDTAKLSALDSSSLILAKVHYATADARVKWLEGKAKEFAGLLTKAQLGNEELGIAAHAIFERIKAFALFSKHEGFREELEWRVVYMPNRDASGELKKYFGYSVSQHRVEPRLKFKIAPLQGVTSPDLSLEKVVDRIILGPTNSSALATGGFLRLLEATKHPELRGRVKASGIPFRSRL